MSRLAAFALGAGLLTGGCGSEPEGESAAALPAELRTADPYARGFTDDDFPRVRALADDVYAYEQLRSAGDESFATVSLFVVTDDGVLVADGQGNTEETRRLIEAIAAVTPEPITHVVICSDHGDHTGGNEAFPPDATFIAHPTSAAALEAAASSPDRPMDAPRVVLPTRLVEEREVLRLGGREIQVLHLGRAHTGGDLVVYLPDEKILFMSEAYLNRVFPAMRSAYPSEWVDMVDRALRMDVDIYVPGHGFVEAPFVLEEELEMFRYALVTVIEEASQLHEAGLTLQEAQVEARFGHLESWTLRDSQGPRAIERVYREIDGELPEPADPSG